MSGLFSGSPLPPPPPQKKKKNQKNPGSAYGRLTIHALIPYIPPFNQIKACITKMYK